MDTHPQNPGQTPAAEVEILSPEETYSAPREDEVAAILRVLRQGERFLVCSHSRPDGDAVGSMLAMGMLLRQMGKHADLYTADPIPAVYRALPGAADIRFAIHVQGHYDAAILLECDSFARTKLRGLEEYFSINIDHHLTGSHFASINWIDRHAVSVGELVHRMVKAAGSTVTSEMATCLYTTVVTDTGSFSYGSTRPATFALAHELTLAGADPVRIAQDIFYSTSTGKLLLLGAALRNLKREGSLAWLWVTLDDMIHTGATEEDCEGIVNYAVYISGVEAAAFLRELPEQRIRVSLRSKREVNVAGIAERLGGGGHENAAGCTLEGPISRAMEEILAQLRPALAGPPRRLAESP
jgi:bifunctional oligoribonuclease and PAP phosphatase NrnA